VRIDTTTASSYADVNEQGLLQLGHSKDHRPDLSQLKLVLASLDLLGLLLTIEVLSGEQKEELAGLFAGNSKRRTAQPTAERLLEAFREVTLTVISAPGFAQRYVTPLSLLQQQILALFGSLQLAILG
jgi:transposase